LNQYDIAYFMASVDDAETNKRFAAEHGGGFPVLSDPQKSAAKAYGVLRADAPVETAFAARFTFYIGPDGRILEVDKGPTGRGVGVKTAGDDMIKKLEALGVKKKK
jgi:peroxiredoxin Q/BCP